LVLGVVPRAHATTIDFAFTNSGSAVAEGSFSYANGLTGVLIPFLHQSDLTI
jgi:hypothetical protein